MKGQSKMLGKIGWAVRLGALVAAVLLVLPVLGACKGDARGDNLAGYELTIADFNGARWKHVTEQPNLYDRTWNTMLDEVKKEYNVKITPLTVVVSDMSNRAMVEVMAGDKYADFVIPTQWASGNMISSEIMLNLNELKEYGVDIATANWVNQDLRKIATLKNDTVYFINTSFISDMPQMWVLYYNRDIWNELNLGDPYKMVENGEWTVEKFRAACSAALKDGDGDGQVSSKEDRWGLIAPGGDFKNAFFLGMGGHCYRMGESGKMEIAFDNEETYARSTMMYQINNIDKSTYYTGDLNTDMWPAWQSGKSLFMGYMNGNKKAQEVKFQWGVLPMPKWNKEQERYMSGVDHNASVFGITNTNENLYEVATLLKAFGEKGMKLESIYWPDFELTYWDTPEDGLLVDNYIAGKGAYDMTLLMSNAYGELGWPMSNMGVNDFKSRAESQMPVIQAALDDAFGE